MSGSNTAPICPCQEFVHPAVIYNAPGLASISYSPGDYLAFRHALLRALPDETELVQVWRPGAEGDLAVQMVEWWAYLSDMLGFYNERIAIESYLRTATLPESVNRLIQVLGYRPRPALGSRGTLAALLTKNGSIVLPKGLQIQSKPGPGKQPQVFELDADTTVATPDLVSAQPVPQQPSLAASSLSSGDTGRLLLEGKVSGIKVGEKLLLTDATALQGTTPADFAWLSVTGTSPGTDAYGQPVTQMNYQVAAGSVPGNADPKNFVLLRGAQSAPPWTYKTSQPVITTTTIELASLARGLDAGQLMLIDVATSANQTATAIVKSNVESVWYANGDGPQAPTESPPGSIPAVAIPHATITFAPPIPSVPDPSAVTVRWNWTSIGTLVADLSPGDVTLSNSGGGTLTPQAGSFPTGSHAVLLDDANGNGASAQATVASDGSLTLSQLSTLPAGGLVPPIDVLFSLLAVSRGKTVSNEILGSGNAAVAGQDFTLSQSPVTYQQDPASKSGDNYSSTVRVWANQIEWTEARSFFGQDLTAPIFVLREDETGKTHVQFGDGVNGARLPTGSNNVVATYRTQAGGEAPASGTLTTAQNPPPGLKALRNPIAPTGGADADPPDRIRSLAPASVFTFGRAVSLEDYQAIVASAPGVVQAQADFVFDPLAQRPVVTLWVAGDDGAIAAAQTALAGTADPNRAVRIIRATPVEYQISLTYLRDPRHEDAVVRAALHDALVDPDAGLFGVNTIRIGAVIYDSQIYQTCLAVPGVQAIHSLIFTPFTRFRIPILRFRRLVSFAPQVAAGSGQHHDPGPGGYFAVPDDAAHVRLSAGAAS